VRRGEECVLLLGGRNWLVVSLDWIRKVAQVVPGQAPGRSRWLGSGPMLSCELCQAIRQVLAVRQSGPLWSRRARERMAVLFGEYAWVQPEGTFLVQDDGETRWWTFAGQLANLTLANAITNLLGVQARADNLFIRLAEGLPADALARLRAAVADGDAFRPPAELAEEALRNLKYSACLPASVQDAIYRARFLAVGPAQDALGRGAMRLADCG
jgi:ATP-dependent Lhr-like helicase